MTSYREHKPEHGEMHLQCSECFAFDKNHYPKCSSLRPFPIQGGGAIPWWLAEVAYEYYHDFYAGGQSLERMAERGGFSVTELVCFIRKNEDYDWARRLR